MSRGREGGGHKLARVIVFVHRGRCLREHAAREQLRGQLALRVSGPTLLAAATATIAARLLALPLDDHGADVRTQLERPELGMRVAQRRLELAHLGAERG